MSATAGCLRDIMETDIMDYMHVDHPYNEKEIWKMKHATPARIGIGHCGPRYTTEAELRFLASHAAANDAVYNEVPEETVRKLGVFEVQTKCANKNEMLLRPDWGRIFLPEAQKTISDNCVHHPQVQIYFGDGLCSPSIEANIPDLFPYDQDGTGGQRNYSRNTIFCQILQSKYGKNDRPSTGCTGYLCTDRRETGTSHFRKYVSIYCLQCKTGYAGIGIYGSF